MTAINADAAISLRAVDKMYRGKVHALRGIDLDVLPGEVFGLLGPNGAGKSTLIKILMTVIRPTQCTGRMLGQPVGHKPTLARVGYLPEHHSFPPHLTGRQILDFYAALNKVPRDTRKARIPQLLELVGMTDAADRKVKGYSKGMRQRIGIAQALMNDPELVLLDEPTDGVDPVGRRDIRDIVKRLSGEGKAVFVNSHILSELEMVTDRVAILVQGKVASHGTIDQLTAGKRSYDIVLTDQHAEKLLPTLRQHLAAEDAPPPDAVTVPEGAASLRLNLPPGPVHALALGRTLRLITEDPEPANHAAAKLIHAGITVASMRPVRPTLEDLFLEAVQHLDGSTDAARHAKPDQPVATATEPNNNTLNTEEPTR